MVRRMLVSRQGHHVDQLQRAPLSRGIRCCVAQPGGPEAWRRTCRGWGLGAGLGPRAAPGVQEAGAQDHDGLAGALLQLHLDGAELPVNDAHHALHLLGRHGPRAALLPQQVHDVGCELVTRLQGGPWPGEEEPLGLGIPPKGLSLHPLQLPLLTCSYFSSSEW